MFLLLFMKLFKFGVVDFNCIGFFSSVFMLFLYGNCIKFKPECTSLSLGASHAVMRIVGIKDSLYNGKSETCSDNASLMFLVKDKKVTIEVTDHGEGIPADKLEHIWDRYYKVDKEHKRGVIGTGLGLSIVKGILDAHNTHYGVKSTEGKGSTFWFELDTVAVKRKHKNKSEKSDALEIFDAEIE